MLNPSKTKLHKNKGYKRLVEWKIRNKGRKQRKPIKTSSWIKKTFIRKSKRHLNINRN